jgi:DegV family protein with EDD domain
MPIVTDSAADLTPDDLSAHDIHVIPLYIQFPEGEARASDLSPDAFYDRLRGMYPAVPSTSQPSTGDFTSVYESLAGQPEPILSIHISAGLSGTVKTAGLAQRQLPDANLHVIDTMTLSPGERFQVLAAARALKKGWSVEQIKAHLDAMRAETEAVFTLETLEYLQKGGRIGRVQALAGSILGIKPIIHVDHADGRYSTLARARTMSQALTQIADHVLRLYGSEPLWVTIIHGQAAERAQQLAEAVQARSKVAQLDTIRISPVLGVHTGPGVIGLGAVPMRHFADL